MIRHTVVFKLKHAKGSAVEKSFLDAAKKLSAISGVQKFECLRQTSTKNNFDYGLYMEFDGLSEYEGYNKHPDHEAFLKDFWFKDVEGFMEIDYEGLD
jgi:heme-degrading monooxygenase HmoA